MHQIIATIIAATFGGLGYLIRRVLRRESLDERISRRLKLITLHKRMKSAGLDADEIRRLELDIRDDR